MGISVSAVLGFIRCGAVRCGAVQGFSNGPSLLVHRLMAAHCEPHEKSIHIICFLATLVILPVFN